MRHSAAVTLRLAVGAVLFLVFLSSVPASGPPLSSGTHTTASTAGGVREGARAAPGEHPSASGSNVTFNETGLPSGSNWSVDLNGSTNHSIGPAIWFTEPNGTYTFSIASLPGYVPSPSSGSVSVNFASVFENISFIPFTFPLNFTESGLPGATDWGVNLSGSLYTNLNPQISLSAANGTYPFVVDAPAGYLAIPASGNATVSNASLTVPITFAPVVYPVVFAQTGLTATNWSVTLASSTTQTNGTNLTFSEPNGTYTFSVGFVAGFQATPTSGSLTVAGAARTINLTFAALPPSKYPLSFNETGLAPGTSWTVQLNQANLSSTGSTIVFLKANGSLPFTIDPVPGYSSSPSNGTARIHGPSSVQVNFTAVLYTVRFNESGLPTGTAWSVELGSDLVSSATSLVGFAVPNGTLAYAVQPVGGYSVVPSSGSVNVSGGNVHVGVTFTAVTYPVDWTETGLPTGTQWSVTVNGATLQDTTSRLAGVEPNGTFLFTVGAVPGFVAFPATGHVTITAGGVIVTISFSPFELAVTVTETGLPAGTFWAVTLGGTFQTGSTASLLFAKPNSTFSYRVTAVAGYTVTPKSGNLTVAGAPVALGVVFTPLPPGTYDIDFSESGLPTGSNWSVNLSGNVSVSSGTQILFTEHNGTYPYTIGRFPGYEASPAAGSVPVEGATIAIPVHFKLIPTAMYSVAFAEQGLPLGTNWTVTFNGDLLHGSSVNLVAVVPNGTYNFTVGMVPGYDTSLGAGQAVVDGAPVVESIVFAPPPRSSVTFTETGLATGTIWTVTLNGTTEQAAGASLLFRGLLAGVYPYSVSATAYAVTPAHGNVTVTVTSVQVALTFTYTGPAHTASTGTTLSIPTIVFLGAMGFVLLVAGAIALATRERNRPPP
jgi:hypothetical protein